MGEKRGNTVKIQYDFNTSGLLEVLLKGEWRRASSREFRSFDTKRRITEPVRTELGNVNVPMRTYEYYGPTYVYDTNIEVTQTDSGKFVTMEYWKEMNKR